MCARSAAARGATPFIRWHAARAKRRPELVRMEGEENFQRLQRSLLCVKTVSSERRLVRELCLARKWVGS